MISENIENIIMKMPESIINIPEINKAITAKKKDSQTQIKIRILNIMARIIFKVLFLVIFFFCFLVLSFVVFFGNSFPFRKPIKKNIKITRIIKKKKPLPAIEIKVINRTSARAI